MGDKITIKLEQRDVQGKKVARLRREGLVPGVVYGHGMDPVMVQAAQQTMEKLVRDAGYHSAVEATVGGKKRIAMIKDIDRDPVRGEVRHVAFHAVKADELVVAEIPVRLVGEGESVAEREGLIVLQAIEQVELRAKPADLPSAIEISVVDLASTDDRITFADVELPEGVEYAMLEFDQDLAIVNVYEPAALEAANEAAAGDAEDESGVESEQGGDNEAAEGSDEAAADDKSSEE